MEIVLSHFDCDGSWRNPSVLIAMIIWGIFLTLISIILIKKYLKKKPKKPIILPISCALFYCLTYFFQGMIAHIIENKFFANEGDCPHYLVLWGDTFDNIITIFASPIFALLSSFIFYYAIKNHKKNGYP
jgi:hypothetical protein